MGLPVSDQSAGKTAQATTATMAPSVRSQLPMAEASAASSVNQDGRSGDSSTTQNADPATTTLDAAFAHLIAKTI